MMKFFRTLTPLGIKVLAALVIGLIVMAVLLWNAWQSGATAKTEARLSTNQTGAAIASGADAVGTVADVGNRAGATDALTQENTDAIRNALGAAAPVPAAVDAVARERLCRRAVYRVRPECLQYDIAE